MKENPADGKPVCENTNAGLGVRNSDITQDAKGFVHPRTGGMSVTPNSPENLPPHHLPSNLGGSAIKSIFSLKVEHLEPHLALRLDPRRPEHHALVEPAEAMPMRAYRSCITDTREYWELAQ